MMLTAAFSLCFVASQGAEAPVADAQGSLRFNRDVRPILSDKCFVCHGPDSAKRAAELRLDDRAMAVSKGAIVPSKPAESAVIERVFSDDPETMMPPPKSNKRLTAEEKATLKRWI